MTSDENDSRVGSGKKKKPKKGKVGKVFPLNTIINTGKDIKNFLNGLDDGDDDDEKLVNDVESNLQNGDDGDNGSDRFKHLNRVKRTGIGAADAAGIDGNVLSGVDARTSANAELIGYFGHLAISTDPNIAIDLDYLELMLKKGADLNCTDNYGQTPLHEVARTWQPDVAVFLIERGSNVNQRDVFGRTPLHVAAAVDFTEMIDTLLQQGADLEALTDGEKQTPLHYAAANDACKALRNLIKKGALLHPRDYKGRTPLQVAAELDRSETARLLLEMGGNASDRDDSDQLALLVMVTKMPSVAMGALNQLCRRDRANRKQYFDLHFLEPVPDEDADADIESRTVLQAIVDFNQLDLIVHPVIKKLVEVKWNQFGKWGAYKQLMFNLLFILMWTVLALSLESPYNVEFPHDIWRITLEACGIILTVFQIIMELNEYFTSKKSFLKWKEWKIRDIERDFQYCHPRWPQEKHFLEQQIEEIQDKSPSYFSETWNLFDWFVYIALVCISLLHVCDIYFDNDTLSDVTVSIFAIVIIFIWIRLMKSVRAFQSLGPFIVMLGMVLSDVAVFLFLYGNFYIPYACAFWMMYGGNTNGTIPSMSTPDRMMYSLFRITLVDEYEYESMRAENVVMTYILLVTFLGISAILCINVLIAQLSNTFQRVYDNASAIALMQQTKITLGIEESLFARRKKTYWAYMKEHCSPLKLYYDDDVVEEQGDDLRKMTFQIQDSLHELDLNVKENQTKKNGSDNALLRRVDKQSVANQHMLKKINRDMKVMQALLMALMEQKEAQEGGGGGGGGRGDGGERDDDGRGWRGGDDSGRGGGRKSRGDNGGDRNGRESRGDSRGQRGDDNDDDVGGGRGGRRASRGRSRGGYDDHRGYKDDDRRGESRRSTSPSKGGRDDDYRDDQSRNLSVTRNWQIEVDDDDDEYLDDDSVNCHENPIAPPSPRFYTRRTSTTLADSLFDGSQKWNPAMTLSQRSHSMPPNLPPLEEQRMKLIKKKNKKDRRLRKQREAYLQNQLSRQEEMDKSYGHRSDNITMVDNRS